MPRPPSDDRGAVLAGGGEMGALMRGIDWSATAVGPVEAWPQSLRTALSILLETGFPMYIAWGRDFTQFYNDGYRPILGSTKHPAAMGISTRETFAEIWDIIGPMFEGVMQGRPTTVVDFMLPLDRHGFTEECYFIFSYSPVREERGDVGGVLVTVTEATSVGEACAIAGRVLARNPADVPFARIYLIADDRRRALLAASCTGTVAPELPASLSLAGGPLARVLLTGRAERLDGGTADAILPSAPEGIGTVQAVPIARQGDSSPLGILVAGTSPRLVLDDAYRDFLALAASQIGSAIAAAQALEEAQARAEALAELDRAKTAFFSNVSHEFRTPLTLMLGPTAEALASPERSLHGDDLETVHRNQLRLLRLVNTLLDFSRIEAGRVNAVFEPTDLSRLTADLASTFRSAIERAGLQLVVDCPPLPVVHVDREMWEKVVLNLLSNAFKFTFRGAITVRLRAGEGHVELQVEDTGTGIPPGDLERVFERFHRVERAAARTHEGSGIGLALVRELVSFHAGSIRASSTVGAGTAFTVRLPLGTAHLPRERLAPAPPGDEGAVALAGIATPFVEEALRWLPPASGAAPGHARGRVAAPAGRVLVADDNADMRDYLQRLLADRFEVEAVGDGAAALEAMRRSPPDVVISDVMMPGMDGFHLIAALRADTALNATPVVLVSARAGEDARVEGLEAGADDYLVKPFSSRELIARVEAQLVRRKLRSLEEAHTLRLATVFENVPVGIAILRGPDHVYEYANASYFGIVGGRAVIGKSVREALPELAGQGIVERLDRVSETGTPYVGRSIRAVLDGPDGPSERYYDLVYQPLADDASAGPGIAVVVFDVTELTMARREAEAASRAKDEFLAMLGHELRNPLAPISTALQLMRLRGVTGAEQERAIIERQVKHLVSLVDDLLDVSRITRGKVQLRRERVDLADAVAKAIEMTSPAIEERRHALQVQVPRGLLVDGDPGRLAQVVANLLTNAAKYTDPGGRIVVTAGREGGEAAVRVADTGRGVSPGMLPKLFDLFTQESQEIARSEGGLGLGLAIVKNLVAAHGGRVEARSDGKGRGATFTIRLPLATGVAAAAPAGVAADAGPPEVEPGLRVLVVDDNVDAAELLAGALRALGHEVETAHDGLSAVEAARRSVPDVVLLDLGLPVLDGFEVAGRIRAVPELSGVEMVAITGYGQEIDRYRTRDAGFDEHLVKPVDLESLEAWLRRSQGRRRAESAGPARV